VLHSTPRQIEFSLHQSNAQRVLECTEDCQPQPRMTQRRATPLGVTPIGTTMARSKSVETQLILATAKQLLEQEGKCTARRLHYLLCGSEIAAVYPNTLKQYNKMLSIITAARKEGILSYELFDDPTRATFVPVSWKNASEYGESVSQWYTRDRWQDQDCRVTLAVEKDSLLSVCRTLARELQITLMSCHGQASSSCCYGLAKTFSECPEEMPQVILGLFDADPAGWCIPESMLERVHDILRKQFYTERDIRYERLGFNPEDFDVCNIDSIETKLKPSDPMLIKYNARFGKNARHAEVDALSKDILLTRIQDAVDGWVDQEKWNAHSTLEDVEKARVLEVLSGI